MHILLNVFLANLLNLALRLCAKIVAIIPTTLYACPFVILVAAPIKKWNLFPLPWKLGWFCELLRSTEYDGSDAVELASLNLKK